MTKHDFDWLFWTGQAVVRCDSPEEDEIVSSYGINCLGALPSKHKWESRYRLLGLVTSDHHFNRWSQRHADTKIFSFNEWNLIVSHEDETEIGNVEELL